MSHEFMEVHEVWRLGFGEFVRYPLSHDSVWVPMSINSEIRRIAEEMSAIVYTHSATIIFKDKEDITAFRLKTGI